MGSVAPSVQVDLKIHPTYLHQSFYTDMTLRPNAGEIQKKSVHTGLFFCMHLFKDKQTSNLEIPQSGAVSTYSNKREIGGKGSFAYILPSHNYILKNC